MSFLKNMFGANEENQSVSKVGWRQLTDLGQLNEIVNVSTEKTVVIFKHSTRCSISRMVLKQFENEFDLQDKIIPYFLDLLAHRDISNAIASRFEVQHQSPQVIVIKEGKAVYTASHESIEVEKLAAFI
ncbi:bacillithiol system redox-active protein YtxJ [Flavobacterium paronense]|uniref:Bacillithiol system redox-active protein YtxJ n=1 Tax=Flavobacterium paronense TaxID=1392775 RepID=A0ABV5GG67_9FLAO|nr:bacillithiol system redox-active protein YtxJ [Flavobacterium paronense]MDN3676942.1 bacillithiol system redox-active protein YtxJ [Flavobacterium paronense]